MAFLIPSFRLLRMAAVSLLPMIGACPAAAAASKCTLGIIANLPISMEGLRASVPTKVNGQDTRFWLDSGAFFSMMSKAKAIELGLRLEALPVGFYVNGIGGRASAELTTIKSFGIVGQDLKNLQFLVGGSDAGNGLIGRNILALADTEFDFANGSVKLVKPSDCGDKDSLAYWAVGKPVFMVPLLNGSNPRDHVIRLPLTINGVRIEAEIDSGAATSLLTRRGARRAGIDVAGPDAKPLSQLNGIGRHVEKGWVVPVQSVDVGGEEILQTHLDVIDGDIDENDHMLDMLLGADFLLAHHVYVARGQHRIYVTYSGGKPFITSRSPVSNTQTAPIAVPDGKKLVEAVENTAAEPKVADDFARRANARLASGNFRDAITDFSEAIRLSPDTAAYYRDRFKAYRRIGRHDLALADLDKALMLAPTDSELLRIRAMVRLGRKDKAGALADAEAAAKATPPASLDMAGLAELFAHLGQPKRAIAMFDTVIVAHRDDSQLGALLNARCWVRALANIDLDKALDDCNRALKRDGAKASYLDSRGLVWFRKGNLVAAVADDDAALKLNPRGAWSLYVRGLARTTLGQAEAGKADLSAALAIRPGLADEAKDYGIGS